MYIDTVTGDYPLTVDAIKERFPATLFAHPFQPPEGFAEVVQTPHPEWNPVIERVVESEPDLIDGVWYRTWSIEKIYSTAAQEAAAIAEHEAKTLADWRQSASCTPFQGRMALSDAGLLTQVQAIVDAADEKTKVAWEYALEWKRTSPMIVALAAALIMTDTQVDDLFKAAQQIEA